jgi:hypothetical protein
MLILQSIIILGLLAATAASKHIESEAAIPRKLRHWNKDHRLAQVISETDSQSFKIYGTDWVLVCPNSDGLEKSYFGNRRNLKGSKKGSGGSKGLFKGAMPPPPNPKVQYPSFPQPGLSKASSKNQYIIHPCKFR